MALFPASKVVAWFLPGIAAGQGLLGVIVGSKEHSGR